MAQPHVHVPQLAAAMLAVGAAFAQQNNAGFGGIYRALNLGAATHNSAHLGCADVAGHSYVSARDPLDAGNHVIYEIDRAGAVTATLLQPAIHAVSEWGMRDLCTDGTHIAGGSEAGISIVTTTGAPATTWNGQPITQPIGGAMLAAIGVPRGLAWDGQAAGGAGRFYAVNFTSELYEFDVQGNVTLVVPYGGWCGSGLALDPVTGNLWIDAMAARGDIGELDRAGGTFAPTGRRIARARLGAFPGGLGEADPLADAHAPWSSGFLLLGVDQGRPDQLTVYRVDRHPTRRGDEEVRMEIGVNASDQVNGIKTFGALDTLTATVRDPMGTLANTPCWTIFNFPPESESDDLTDLSPILPGLGILPEQRTQNPLGVASPTVNYLQLPGGIGVPISIPMPAALPIPPGFLIRVQTLYFDAAAAPGIVSTNEAYWRGGEPQTGIIVEAAGASSFVRQASRGFWAVRHLGGHAAIASVTLSWNSSVPAHQNSVFDVDDLVGGGRHDAGNASGCTNTWRNGCDVATGLDYAYVGNHAASCAVGAENAGFTIDVGTPDAVRQLTYRFAGGLFGAGGKLEFDCDTDGGLGVAGAAMRGLVVTVMLVDSTQFNGELSADPVDGNRASVRF